jgi:hypothetical protein
VSELIGVAGMASRGEVSIAEDVESDAEPVSDPKVS